jgi:hypothetical protein
MENNNFKLIRKLKWEEVFLFWHQSEGMRKNWIDLAKKRGFKSWADWRLTKYARPFDCSSADWGLYEVNNPTKIIPTFYGGPFRTWIKRHYNGAKEKTFNDLASQPNIFDNQTVKQMVKNFPKDNIITCLKLGKKNYVIEGMHRSCALAVMNRKDQAGPKKIIMAIGQSKLKNLPIVGRVG